MGSLSNKQQSGFSAYSTAEQVTEGIDGTSLTAIVTGASSCIGVETERVLALLGVHVVIVVRNIDAGANVKEAILKEIPNAKIDAREIDLTSFTSVRKFAADYRSSGLPLNILMGRSDTIQTFSRQYRTPVRNESFRSFSSHKSFVGDHEKHITRKQHRGRIVNVSSLSHQYGYHEGIFFDKLNDEPTYSRHSAYAQSKLANILHANELTRRLMEEGAEVTANSLHPGTILTNLLRYDGFLKCILKVLSIFISKTVQQGAATTCFVALHPQLKGVGGEYFVDCNIAKPSSQAKDADLATRLWYFSLSLTNAK